MAWNPPDRCANGHPLQPGNAIVSWGPCDCAKASGTPRGHRKVRCSTCGVYWYEDGCDYGS